MKAKDLTGEAPGGERVILKDELPLSTPYVVQIFPFYGCNFKCSYCIFQYPSKDRHFISDKVAMDLRLYKKCIDDMTKFPEKVRVLRFVGVGEPLMWKYIVEAVKYAKEKDVAKTVEILTNGAYLSSEMSNSLIDAGLDRLVISIQGTSEEKYREVCNTRIDFTKFLMNIEYFYNRKKDTHMYIKIVDTALGGDLDKKKFFHLFGNICDSIGIEYTVPLHVANKRLSKRKVTQFGKEVSEVEVCTVPFTFMELRPDGNVTPCYNFEAPYHISNAYDDSLFDIWNGKEMKKFRMKMIKNKKGNKVCKKCEMVKYRRFEEDNLDDSKDKLKEIYR